MALYDSKLFVLSHIRHSYILSDNTGNSESVLNGGGVDYKRLGLLGDSSEDEGGEDQKRSFDIRLKTSHRLRSNTEIKFEKFKRDRRNAPSKIKTIVLLDPSEDLDPEKAESLFPTRVPHLKSGPSLLSHQLTHFFEKPENPFTIYQHFDASNSAEEDVARITVYVPWSSSPKSPVHVCVYSSTKIHEIIGFVCYKYSQENRQPPPKKRIEFYDLFLVDENGDVEKDFPPIKRQDPISKFGFSVFGLVDLGTVSDSINDDKNVTVFFPDGTSTDIELKTKEITIKELMDKSFEERKLHSNPRVPYQYNMERKDTPGLSLDPNTILNSISTNEFYIVRLNSKRRTVDNRNSSGGNACERGKNQSGGAATDAEVYQLFQDIYIYTKVRTKVIVDIDISEEKIEIYPKRQVSSAKFWAKQKPASYKMENIVACDIIDKKSSGNWVFNLVFTSDHGYKKHELECPGNVAAKIHSKVNQLLSLHSSTALKEYLEHRERKLHRRQSWHFNIK